MEKATVSHKPSPDHPRDRTTNVQREFRTLQPWNSLKVASYRAAANSMRSAFCGKMLGGIKV